MTLGIFCIIRFFNSSQLIIYILKAIQFRRFILFNKERQQSVGGMVTKPTGLPDDWTQLWPGDVNAMDRGPGVLLVFRQTHSVPLAHSTIVIIIVHVRQHTVMQRGRISLGPYDNVATIIHTCVRTSAARGRAAEGETHDLHHRPHRYYLYIIILYIMLKRNPFSAINLSLSSRS